MKRLIVALVLLLFISAQGLNVCAQGLPPDFTVWDLSEYGLPSVVAECCQGWNCDGVISHGEYGSLSEFAVGKGLSYLNSDGSMEYYGTEVETNGTGCYEDVCVSYDQKYFYFAVSFSPAASEQMALIEHPRFGSSQLIEIEICLDVPNQPFETVGIFTNDYFFSGADCVGVTGQRTCKVGSDLKLVGRISSTGKSEIPYSLDSDSVWNGERYRNEVCFSKGMDGSSVLEGRIPMGDLLATLTDSVRATFLSSLNEEKGFLCGGIVVKTAVAESVCFSNGSVDQLMLTTGISSSSVCPSSDSGETWKQALSERYSVADTSTFAKLSPPLYWCKTHVPKQPVSSSETDQISGSNPFENGVSTEKTEENLYPNDFDSIPSVITSTEAEECLIPPSDSTSDVPDYSSLLADLELVVPDEGTAKETEIEWVEDEYADASSQDNALASFLIFGSGILLLCAVIGIGMIFRAAEKREKLLAEKRKSKKS